MSTKISKKSEIEYWIGELITSPVFIFPRLNMSAIQIRELLFRLNRYGEEWSKSHSSTLVVFIPENEKTREMLRNFRASNMVVSLMGRNSLINTFFPLQAVKHVRSIDSRFTLICGDLLLAPVSAFIIKCFFPFRVRSQISLHGNPSSTWGISPLGIAKRLLMRFALRNSESIRVVSTNIKNYLCDVKGLPSDRIVVAPIPTVLPMRPRIAASAARIGFVGRLHDERNTDEWSEIVGKLLNVDPDFSAIVIGDGSGLLSMKAPLTSFIDGRVRFIGEISKQELEESWDEISILLSPAKQEGFGLAIREALIRGVFVIARRNPGTQFLFEKMKGIYLYDSVGEAVDLAHKLKGQEFLDSDLVLNLDYLSLENRESLSALVAGWEFN
jgi:glycosyltransferase involved in cell wall biosynthesis